MRAQRGDSEQTRAEILKAARHLFAENSILSVSVREVAREAGVTHGLVHHYFGTKEQLAAEVIQREIVSTSDLLAANPITVTGGSVEAVRKVVRHFLTDGKESVLLMVRAELDNLEPERTKLPGMSSPLEMMTRQFAELQVKTGSQEPLPDPALVSIFLGAALVGLVLVHPWLMASAGLVPEDYEQRLDEFVEMGVAFVAQAVGITPGKA